MMPSEVVFLLYRTWTVQVLLEHAPACNMDARAKQNKEENLIPLDELERRFMDKISQMTLGSAPPYVMYRCINEEIRPQKLGPRGVRKVRMERGRQQVISVRQPLVLSLKHVPCVGACLPG